MLSPLNDLEFYFTTIKLIFFLAGLMDMNEENKSESELKMTSVLFLS